MIKLVYDKGGCVGCPPEMGCLGRACSMCWDTIMVCDQCGEEVDDLYRNEDGDFCEDCMRNLFIHIDINNAGDYCVESEGWL